MELQLLLAYVHLRHTGDSLRYRRYFYRTLYKQLWWCEDYVKVLGGVPTPPPNFYKRITGKFFEYESDNMHVLWL